MFERIYSLAAGRIAARRQERRQSRALKSIAAFREKAERIYWDIFDGKPLDRHLEDPGLPKEIRAIVECVVARAGSGPVENLGAEAPAMSVVIPHYNHAQYLGDCLEGLCRQTVAPTEVVVVDDLSDDRPELPRICKGFEGRLNLRLLLPDRKLYCGGARQMGAEVSTAEIVVMHDADDVSHPERLEITREVFRRNPGTWHLTAGWVPFDGVAVDYVKEFDLSVLDKSVVGPAELAAAMSRLFAEQRFSQDVCGQTRWGHYGVHRKYGTTAGHCAYRRPLAAHHPWPTPDRFVFAKYEDFEFNLLLFLCGRKSLHADLPLVYYRQRSTTNRCAPCSASAQPGRSGNDV